MDVRSKRIRVLKNETPRGPLGKPPSSGRGESGQSPPSRPTKVNTKPGDSLDARELQPVDTSSPEFRKWFGDSVVVDSDGAPLVVYHGTRHSFDSFDTDSLAQGWGRGAYFSSSPEFAGEFGDRVMPVYLRLENPYRGEFLDEATVLGTRAGRGVVAHCRGRLSYSTPGSFGAATPESCICRRTP